MQLPANFDSVSLDGVINDWMSGLREFSVESVLVLGPDPFAGQEERLVLALHPPRLLDAAQALAESRDFGALWRDSDAPLVAWQDISKSAFENLSRWRRLWRCHIEMTNAGAGPAKGTRTLGKIEHIKTKPPLWPRPEGFFLKPSKDCGPREFF